LSLFGRSGGATQRSLATTRAIASFQNFAHLPVTGKLDDATKRKMLAPRCGMVDVARTHTRAAYVYKWEKSVLKWALEKPTNQLSAGQVRMAIKQAFEVWSKVIPMNFTEVQANSGADMQFGFGPGEHGDVYKFDGQGGVLAHAFFPSDGRLHFDDDEKWAFEDAAKIKEGSFTDLLSVTIHELGHSLGLPHSDEEEAIMYPFYRHPELDTNQNIKQFQMSHFDIAAIQDIYGPREGGVTARPPPTPEPTPPGPPSTGAVCPRFQAAATSLDGATYFFLNGDNIGWRKANVNDAANTATKFYVDRRFPGAPSNGITAAITDKRDQRTFLFQGRRVFAYSWKSSTKSFILDSGFPKDLQNDVPFTPEGAFQLREGHIILHAGDQFVIWDSNANSGSFKNNISYFQGLPANVKVSFAVGEDKVYFLNADNYSVYDFKSSKVISTQSLKSLITC